MSIIDYAMRLFSGVSTAIVACPDCGLKSVQSVSKIRRNQALLCPGCKNLFISRR
ncbi:YnfU family zinc-binding protein [Entomohabitans teleogrylli]|uniref:YnfU family zinc-binding protein n=1 Tax=Entomohabitans teleogrylli TaxID=1384589 RepID=UPI0023DE03AB|nr:YnfU family zinc-binding protein [Entomohabitans teleogrylli]